MKKLYFFLLGIAALQSGLAQTIRRVNNNAGVSGVNVYSSISAAHAAAVANDILIIEPSVTSYGDITLTKPLKIYGNGYFLDINTELKADQRSSTLGTITCSTGSGGSSFYGITAAVITNNYTNGGHPYTIYNVSDITVDRCNINVFNFITPASYTGTYYIGITNLSNIIITKSYVTNYISVTCYAAATISNVLIANNIIVGYISAGPVVSASGTGSIQNGVVRNNTILNQTNVGAGVIWLANSVLEDNLFANSVHANFSNVTYSYNVSSGNSFSGGVGNQNNFAVSSAFIGAGTGISTDETYQLKAGSSLKTASSSGAEVGAYGGPTPYIVSGIPPIPSIVSMVNTSSGSNSVPLQVTIGVKSNN